MTSVTRQQLNRALVGIIAVGCLCAGAAFTLGGSESDNFWGGSFVRSGLLLGAFWVGMPTRGRAAAWANVSPWTVIGTIIAVIIMLRRPQVFLPLAAVLGFLTVVVPMFLPPRHPPGSSSSHREK